MTKAAVKERDEPALPLGGMKDVTPKKDAKKPEPEKPAAKVKSTAIATTKAKPAALPASLDSPQAFLELLVRAGQMLTKGDVAVAREIMAMKDEQLEKIRVQEYNVAFHAARALMPPIAKDGKAPNYRYPTLENVSRSIDKIAQDHGFAHRFSNSDSPIPNHYRIVCELSHVNGHKERHNMDLPADSVGQKGTVNKSPVQAVNSTFSIARRYLKMGIWDLVIVGSDAEGDRVANNLRVGTPTTQTEFEIDPSVPMIDGKQANNVLDAIADCGVKQSVVFKHFKINKIEELPLANYQDALDACSDYKAKHPELQRKK